MRSHPYNGKTMVALRIMTVAHVVEVAKCLDALFRGEKEQDSCVGGRGWRRLPPPAGPVPRPRPGCGRPARPPRRPRSRGRRTPPGRGCPRPPRHGPWSHRRRMEHNASANASAPRPGPGPGLHPGPHAGHFSAPVAALLATLMALLALATVLGNALVVVAFAVDRSLHSRGNFFFLNLAVADLLVGGFCIPLYIPYVLTGEWKFGKGLCKLWLVTDYLVCTASVFNIVFISYDRFISVTKAVTYRAQKGTTRDAVFKMVLVWVAAFLLYGPAIISWEYVAKRSILPRGQCYAEFFYNWYFLMTASIIEFFTPFISVTYFNLSIYINIQKRTSLRNDNIAHGQDGLEMDFQGRKKKHIFFVKAANRRSRKRRDQGLYPKHKGLSFDVPGTQDLPSLQVDLRAKAARRRQNHYRASESVCNAQKQQDLASTVVSRLRLSRDKRVAKSLAIIVCVFGLCWAPYTLLMIIRAACHGTCIQHSLYETSFWLLWLNSAINPILYPLCHVSFRKAFIKLLCPGKAKIHPHMYI
ncbi:histamine H3 receptor-like [Cynocephalus volans]|uniref:histamine H3 receptor-like n=1 Tax=Cynocephalus volans TaxID=110931 RepID=UPI002FCBC093